MTAVQELNKRLQALPESERERIASALLKEMEAQALADPNSDLAVARSTWERADYKPFPVEQRVPGLGQGTITMADDFDAPLPDAFWLGEE